jgi:hypothetical protein
MGNEWLDVISFAQPGEITRVSRLYWLVSDPTSGLMPRCDSEHSELSRRPRTSLSALAYNDGVVLSLHHICHIFSAQQRQLCTIGAIENKYYFVFIVSPLYQHLQFCRQITAVLHQWTSSELSSLLNILKPYVDYLNTFTMQVSFDYQSFVICLYANMLCLCVSCVLQFVYNIHLATTPCTELWETHVCLCRNTGLIGHIFIYCNKLLIRCDSMLSSHLIGLCQFVKLRLDM